MQGFWYSYISNMIFINTAARNIIKRIYWFVNFSIHIVVYTLSQVDSHSIFELS